MKKYLILISFFLIVQSILYSQVPDKLNYQAVLRDNAGEIISNQNVDIEVSIVDALADGNVLYSEEHSMSTNSYGIVNLTIGEGSMVQGDFADLNWAISNKFINVKIDVGDGYIDMGTVRLVSVPYSFYADLSDSSDVSRMAYTANTSSFADSASVAALAHNSYTADFATNADLANTLSSGVYTTNTDTLFVVKDHDGNVVFAVFPDGAKVYINQTTKGKIGGFAVSGRNPAKALEVDILNVTVDSTRIYVNDNSGVKGKIGGFAVSGRNPAKGTSQHMFFATTDSTRIYTQDTISGFGIQNYDGTKGNTTSYMQLTPVNYFIGHESGRSMTTGLYNSFLGYQTGKNSTVANDNVFIGYQVGLNNISGGQNVFVGTEAGENNTTGTHNVFMGHQSGYSNTGGNYNSFLGFRSGYFNSSGSNNLFLGYESGYNNSLGNNNLFVGYQCGYANTSGSVNLFLGYQSGFSNTIGDNNLFVGKYSGYSNTTGGSNTFIGSQAGQSNVDGTDNLFIGTQSGVANSSGNYNTFLGSSSGAANTSGSHNTFLGYMAGFYNTTGVNNTFLGKYSGYGNTTGFYNIYIGYSAAGGITTGSRNISIGDQTLYYNTTGINNTILGYQAGYNTTGSSNVLIGYSAGYNETGSGKLYIDNSNTSSPLIYGDFSTNRLVINGNSTHNTNNRTLFVNGSAGGTTAWSNDSDVRLKRNISTITDAVDKIMKLRGVNFEWIDDHLHDKGNQIGFIAQEAAQVLPEVVNHNGDYYSMQYAPITAVLVEAMKEQQSQIEGLKSENELLKEKLNQIIKLLEDK